MRSNHSARPSTRWGGLTLLKELNGDVAMSQSLKP